MKPATKKEMQSKIIPLTKKKNCISKDSEQQNVYTKIEKGRKHGFQISYSVCRFP